ncbi:hypothetical protein GCM10017674_67080 [Streptomyces gardneri]|uniref:Uncharacterized protein n=1 Tax=Streptomyces gardneri TaxID=66892 RepID=A0A4Y3RJE8_9ACTN|nr:hypothetical protein SGA01_26530 [Streptomyces gardneri]GHH16775.1 hypothetical protein GCM10017674_67080 [Streptomyces gardneri]
MVTALVPTETADEPVRGSSLLLPVCASCPVITEGPAPARAGPLSVSGERVRGPEAPVRG